MFLKKLSKKEKIKERKARNEFNLIIKRYRAIGFDYVCSHPPPARICFGTSLQREILPTFGPSLNSFMARLTIKPNIKPNIKPPIRKPETILKKNQKKIGFGPLANKTPRLKPITNDLRPFYTNHQKTVCKKSMKPFAVGFDRNSEKSLMLTPAPSTYKQFQKENRFKSSFGGERKELPAVQMICDSKNLSICDKCNEIPFGDYWRHFGSLKDLCRSCMKVEIENAIYRSITKSLKIKRLDFLHEYERVRYCDFHHDHQNTTASIKLLTPKVLTKKIRHENYLAMFNI